MFFDQVLKPHDLKIDLLKAGIIWQTKQCIPGPVSKLLQFAGKIGRNKGCIDKLCQHRTDQLAKLTQRLKQSGMQAHIKVFDASGKLVQKRHLHWFRHFSEQGIYLVVEGLYLLCSLRAQDHTHLHGLTFKLPQACTAIGKHQRHARAFLAKGSKGNACALRRTLRPGNGVCNVVHGRLCVGQTHTQLFSHF